MNAPVVLSDTPSIDQLVTKYQILKLKKAPFRASCNKTQKVPLQVPSGIPLLIIKWNWYYATNLARIPIIWRQYAHRNLISFQERSFCEFISFFRIYNCPGQIKMNFNVIKRKILVKEIGSMRSGYDYNGQLNGQTNLLVKFDLSYMKGPIWRYHLTR